MGITDYESVMGPLFTYVSGIMAVKEFRITTKSEGIIYFLYRSNSSADG